VQQLHLVGFTTDHRGLIFSVRRGAKSGGFTVKLDDSVLTAVEELRALIAEEQEAQADGKGSSKRPESSLSVREVQARLRRGRTIEQVAREAGVDAAWVSRFAVPVLAEQAEIIRTARATRMTKQRVGLSGAPLGDAVYRNLAERGLTDPRAELDKAWRARQLTDGMWRVSIKYTLRGRESEAVWEYDEVAGALRARGRLATQLGFREPPRRASKATAASRASTASATKAAKPAKKAKKTTKAKKAKKATKATKARPGARPKKATTAVPPTTARRSSSRQAAKRVAAARRKAAARMESEAERATRRNAALARKAAAKPVVLLPLPPSPLPPPPQPLLLDERSEEPPGWDDDLDLAWDDTDQEEAEREVDELVAELVAEEADELEPEGDVELEPEADVEREPEADVQPGPEDEPESEGEVEVEPVAARPARRRQLRARPADPASAAEQARRQVRVHVTDDGPEPAEGNGPVFRTDLAQPASSPVPPLSLPLEPIEPPPRRRRLRARPLRGR